MIDVHYASLASRRVRHRVFYLDGHPSRYQPHPTGLNFSEQTGTRVFPLVIAVHIDLHYLSSANKYEDHSLKNLFQSAVQKHEFHAILTSHI